MSYVLTTAFCSSAMLANCLIQAKKKMTENMPHYVIWGHWPIDKKQTEKECRFLCDTLEVEWLDPGKDLGSAQSQNWAIEKIGGNHEVMISIDPDSQCLMRGWDAIMLDVIKDPRAAMVHTNSDVIYERWKLEPKRMREDFIAGWPVLEPGVPEQFNITAFKLSVLEKLGGIQQYGRFYGQVEIPMYYAVRKLGFKNFYMRDVFDDETPKILHDPRFRKWKSDHAVTNKFLGAFEEYLKVNP